MRKTLSVLFTLTALSVAVTAIAADTSGDPSSRREQRAQRRQQFFDQIDTNHDGSLSRAEYQAWVDSRFDGLDTNKDGVVDADEVAHSAAAAGRANKRAQAFIQRFDTTGSGTVSKADFEAKAMQRFDRLSQGADSVTQDQFEAARPFHHHRRGAMPADGG